MMVDDDDVGFGEFKFQSLNPKVHSNPTVIDGRDSAVAAATDDDDWGDFDNSGGLAHTLSLPQISKPLDLFDFSTEQKMKNNECELNQPGSAPGRVNSDMAQWEKPKGALPLSIFGDLEGEEEKSGVVEPNRNAHPPDSSCNWVYPNGNDLNANGKDEMKLNSHWDPLNLNTNVTNSNKDGTNLVSKEVKWSSNGGNSVLVADNWGFDNGGDDDDDNGREFKDAEPKTPLGDEISKIKTESMPILNFNGTGLS
ncbi:hypothetical protein P3X46_035122 [Hevea brasiliensis]|uniref:Condensin complex subunit 2 n=1 Tax=Hevea brasiliensis TaxID=3981 RepID=A0ABQ9KAQ5_HEVBR|nr:hypothetical protein P3X46_035122 [Hevea brasiliensis]